jgi:hypothetical protein
MRIDTAGRVTMPFQPAFLAASNAGSPVLSAGSRIPFNVTNFNIGSNFNTGNARFTAPIAGRYHFDTGVWAFTQGLQFVFRINNVETSLAGDNSPLTQASSSNSAGTMSIIFNLNANDFVEVFTRSSGSSGTIYSGHCYFSGHLIG